MFLEKKNCFYHPTTPETSISKMSLKIAFKNETRRIGFDPSSLNFNQLLQIIKRLFTSTMTENEFKQIQVHYLDDENDDIIVITDKQFF